MQFHTRCNARSPPLATHDCKCGLNQHFFHELLSFGKIDGSPPNLGIFFLMYWYRYTSRVGIVGN